MKEVLKEIFSSVEPRTGVVILISISAIFLSAFVLDYYMKQKFNEKIKQEFLDE